MNELGLPAAPPLPPEVRERALAEVLAGADAPRSRRPPAVAAVAAVVVVALLVTTAVAISGLRGDDPLHGTPAAPPPATRSLETPRPTRIGPPQPQQSMQQITESFRARCADAVQQSGKAAQYPPAAQWRVTDALGTGALEPEVVINDDFACLLTPTTVTVSARASAQTRDVTVVRMSEGDIVVLDPKRLEYEVGEQADKLALGGGSAVEFHMLYGPGTPKQVLLTLTGRKGRDPGLPPVALSGQPGTAPHTTTPDPTPPDVVQDVAPLVTFADHPSPKRPDTPDGAALTACMDKAPTHAFSFPEYWTPVARHYVPGEPKALLARIGDVAAGYCKLDPAPAGLPDYYWAFDGVPLTPLRDPQAAEVVMAAQPLYGVATAILRLPKGVVRAVMTMQPPGNAALQTAECTVADDLAICTVAVPGSVHATATDPEPWFEYLTFTSRDPGAKGTPVR